MVVKRFEVVVGSWRAQIKNLKIVAVKQKRESASNSTDSKMQ